MSNLRKVQISLLFLAIGNHAIAADGTPGTSGSTGSPGASASGTSTNSATVIGGNGTNATINGTNGTDVGNGGAGGKGGAGGTGIPVANATLTNSSSITGGNGGNGSIGGNAGAGPGKGGPGGVGGTGGAGIAGSTATITNSGTVTGGIGGIGNYGGLDGAVNGGQAPFPATTGNGGVGGAGIRGTFLTIINTFGHLIEGGKGGKGGTGGANGGNGGIGGIGGAGISGSDLNISNAGTIRGGFGGDLGPIFAGANANPGGPGAIGAGIEITGGVNTINNLTGGSIIGGEEGLNYPGSIKITGGSTSITNAGAISGSLGHGILLQGGNTVITNTGSISGGTGWVSGNAIDISAGTASIVNLGTIDGGAGQFGIHVTAPGSLVTLDNVQGGAGALTYKGILPINYNVIIQSPSIYGQLVGSNLSGFTRFGIAAGSTLALGTYAGVLRGFQIQNIDGTTLTGRADRYRWFLAEDADPSTLNTWDLTLVRGGPDAANTMLQLQSNASSVRSVLNQRTSSIGSMMDYDCMTFDAKGYCVSFRARYTGMDSQNEGAGVLTAAYRANANIRIGGFIDYRLSEKDSAGLKHGDTMPTFGAFAAYSERGDATGLQAKASAAYNSGKISVTRNNSLPDTEPGSGKAALSTYAIGAELSWGVAIAPTMLATPYAGIRYSDATRKGYTEGTIPGTEYPISYNAYYQRLTTATAGIRLSGMFSEKVGYQVSLGGEYDLAHKANAYSGTSTIPDLETFALANTGSSNRTRVVASTGLYYQMDKTQRLTASVGVRGQAYSSQPSVTTLVGYQVAF